MNVHRNFNLIVMFVLFYTASTYLGQEIIRTINFSQNEKVLEIKSNQLYTAVFTYTSSKTVEDAYKVCIYDNNGNEIFKKTVFEQIPVSLFFNKNHENIIIVMNGGETGPDIIKAINIKSGKELWKVNSCANEYVISPDGTKLLTAIPPFDNTAMFQIIDIELGEVRDILDNHYYAAEWFDNDRIIFCNRIFPENAGPVEREPKSELDQITQELEKLATLHKENRIEEDDYNRKVKDLIDKRRFIISNTPKREEQMKTRSKLNRIELLKKRKTIPADKVLEFVVFNIVTNRIEKQIPLIANSKNINITYQAEDINTITIDSDKNIYITGYIDTNRFLFKYDKNLKLLKSYEIKKYSRLTKFRDGKSLLFRQIIKGGEINILGEDDEEFHKYLPSDDLPGEISYIDRYINDYEISERYLLLNNMKTLVLKKLGGER